jgi:hypothetical protein
MAARDRYSRDRGGEQVSQKTDKQIRHKAEQYRNRNHRAAWENTLAQPFKVRCKIAWAILRGKRKVAK